MRGEKALQLDRNLHVGVVIKVVLLIERAQWRIRPSSCIILWKLLASLNFILFYFLIYEIGIIYRRVVKKIGLI